MTGAARHLWGLLRIGCPPSACTPARLLGLKLHVLMMLWPIQYFDVALWGLIVPMHCIIPCKPLSGVHEALPCTCGLLVYCGANSSCSRGLRRH